MRGPLSVRSESQVAPPPHPSEDPPPSVEVAPQSDRPVSVDPGLVQPEQATTPTGTATPADIGDSCAQTRQPTGPNDRSAPAHGESARPDHPSTSSRQRPRRSQRRRASTASEDEKTVSDTRKSHTTPDGPAVPVPSSSPPDFAAPEEAGPQGAGRSSSPQRKFVVDRILSHEVMSDGTTSYWVRWFGYPPSHDTLEPTGHIPSVLRALYWNRVRRYEERSASAPERANSRRRGRRSRS